MLDTDAYLPQLTIFEGSVPFMYVDTAANVTVGVGNLLANPASAQALAFVVRPTDGSDPAQAPAATPDQIAAEFASVSGQQKGEPWPYYKQFTTLELPDAAIQALLLSRVQGFTAELIGAFPEFNSYPDPACAALFDMAFNLGLNGLLTKFPHFCQAVRNQDWATAAAQCTRGGIQASRNAWTAAQFQAALRATAGSEAAAD